MMGGSCRRLSSVAGVAFALLFAGCDREPRRKVPKTDRERMSYAIGLHLGKRLHRQQADVDPERVLLGFRDALNDSKDPLLATDEIRNTLQTLSTTWLANERAVLDRERRINEVAGAAALRMNARYPGVVVLPSGIQYRVLQAGDAERPALDDRVTLEYEVRLLDGSVLGRSQDQGVPVIMRLNRSPRAWQEVVPRIGRGASVEIHVPGELASAHYPSGLAGPHEAMVFTLRLLSIDRTSSPSSVPDHGNVRGHALRSSLGLPQVGSGDGSTKGRRSRQYPDTDF